MHDAGPSSSVEQRRKLLKGALGASSVITMGYSGAALASFQCVADTKGFPTSQFRLMPPDSTTSTSWAWVEVSIERYRAATPVNNVNGLSCSTPGNSNRFDAFKVNNIFYKIDGTTTPPTLVGMPTIYCKDTDQSGYPKKGWVLAYFDNGGNPTGSYPTIQSAGTGQAPAQHSCLASINPNLNLGGFTFGGG